MHPYRVTKFVLAPAFAATAALSAHAQIAITEVAAWSSGNSSLAADWFELTNTGSSAVSVSGWKMDDSSPSFATAVSMSGITSIAAGESVIFIESSANLTTLSNQFKNLWLGSTSGSLQIGEYSGSGVSLSTGGDAVNIYNSTGTLLAGVTFGSNAGGPSFQTFDNTAKLSGAISQLSSIGVNGAFAAANDIHEIGSPGLA